MTWSFRDQIYQKLHGHFYNKIEAVFSRHNGICFNFVEVRQDVKINSTPYQILPSFTGKVDTDLIQHKF